MLRWHLPQAEPPYPSSIMLWIKVALPYVRRLDPLPKQNIDMHANVNATRIPGELEVG